MSWYIKALENYFVFGGRAGRKEFWYFSLFNFLMTLLFIMVDYVIYDLSKGDTLGMFVGLYSLGMFIPSLSVASRRLHDVGRSTWWFMINIIPLLGTIILLIFLASPSQPNENKWG